MKKFLSILVCFLLALFLSVDKSIYQQNISNGFFRFDIVGANDSKSFDVSPIQGMKFNVLKSCKDCVSGTGDFKEYGNGKSVQGTIHADKSGTIIIRLMGPDIRENGEHVPVFVTYNNLIVDGETIFNEPIKVWHEETYKHKIHVEAGQTVEFSVVPAKADFSSAADLLRVNWLRFTFYFCVLFVIYALTSKALARKKK